MGESNNSLPQQSSFKDFQLERLSIKDKSNYEWGLKIAQQINGTLQGGYSGYYFSRNARFRMNRNLANGRDTMKKFIDLLEFDGKTNYANLNWDSIKIYNRIISGLVGRWMNRNEKVDVKATDPLSVKQKKEEVDAIEFIMYNRQMLEKLQQESGVQMIPQDKPIPADADELNLWVTQFQRLPEEIRYEMGVNDILAANGWFDVQKEKCLHDSAEVGFVGTFTYMDKEGVVHVDYVKPENALYSWSEYSDFRDTKWRGQVKSLRISDLRKQYGKEFNPNNPHALTEEELFEIAATAKEYQLSDKITWHINYNFMYMRPYDEWNVDIIDFELKSLDSEPYTVVTTKKNKSTLLKKGRKEKKDDNEEIIDDTRYNIYRGVFLRNQNKMLEWGLKKNMIRPQDPKEIGNAEFSYSFYMYQPYEMRNVAVPEKIQEPADQMILARLKMQQLVAKMKPAGAAYNVDALQELELGLSSGKASPVQLQKIYEQTGNMYYRGRDAEGNPIPIPIQELANSGFVGQMQGLIQLYQFHYQVLKDELGEDPALLSQALQPRVSIGNVDTAQEVAANATDYMYNAYKWVMADTAKKIACLLKNSVEYGSNAYRAAVKEEDVVGRIYGTEITMLPSGQDIMRFEANMNQYITANPDLVLFIDPFQLMRVAKDNVKLAETLFRQGQKKMLLDRQNQAAQNAQMNAQAQQESLKLKAEADAQLMQQELTMKGQLESSMSEGRMKETILKGVFDIYSKGIQMPSELNALSQEIIQNVGLPLFAQNVMAAEQIAQEQEAMAAQEQAEAQESPMEQMQEVEQPTEEEEMQMQEEQVMQ